MKRRNFYFISYASILKDVHLCMVYLKEKINEKNVRIRKKKFLFLICVHVHNRKFVWLR